MSVQKEPKTISDGKLLHKAGACVLEVGEPIVPCINSNQTVPPVQRSEKKSLTRRTSEVSWLCYSFELL